MFVHSNEKKNYLCLCLFVDYRKKVQKTCACQTRVPYYKELELGKLDYHRRKKKRRSSFVFTKNSNLVSSSIVLHGTQVYQARVSCGIFSIKKSTST